MKNKNLKKTKLAGEYSELFVKNLISDLEKIIKERENFLISRLNFEGQKRIFEKGYYSLHNEFKSIFNFLSNYLTLENKEKYSNEIESKLLNYKAKIYDVFLKEEGGF